MTSLSDEPLVAISFPGKTKKRFILIFFSRKNKESSQGKAHNAMFGSGIIKRNYLGMLRATIIGTFAPTLFQLLTCVCPNGMSRYFRVGAGKR